MVVASSPMGITVNDIDAGVNATFTSEQRFTEHTANRWVGIHDTIVKL